VEAVKGQVEGLMRRRPGAGHEGLTGKYEVRRCKCTNI